VGYDTVVCRVVLFQRNIIASIFRVEVNQVGKFGEYIMEGGGGGEGGVF